MTTSQIRSYLNQKITLKRGKAPDEYGEPNEPLSFDLRARVDWENKVIVDNYGKEVASIALILVVFDSTITYDDVFTIDGRDHAIVQINRVQDFSANHWEIRIR